MSETINNLIISNNKNTIFSKNKIFVPNKFYLTILFIFYILICKAGKSYSNSNNIENKHNSNKYYEGNDNKIEYNNINNEYDYYKGKYKKEKTKNNLSKNQNFNISTFENIWDFSNIPEHILKTDNFDEILSELASRKYKTCKASVIYHPFKKEFYFRNPLGSSNSFKDYIKLKCKDFLSREISLRQRFLITKKELEELLDNNQDSILNTGKHELTDIRNGLEMSLFPVKFYKSIQENNYSYSKYLLCYDTIKVLGIDSKSDNYFIISAMDKHRILRCNSSFDNKDHLTMNNFIKYTSYCDEFCNEDYVYFSNDLIKCKCEFYYQNKNKGQNMSFSGADKECFYRRKFDVFEKFSHPYEMNEKLLKIDQHSKPHIRYYFNALTIIFALQLLYLYYFVASNRIFIRLCIFSAVITSILGYLYIRINFQFKELFNFQLVFEIVHDIYPILLILFFNLKFATRKNYAVNLQSLIESSKPGLFSKLFQLMNITKNNQTENNNNNNLTNNSNRNNENENTNNINLNNFINESLNANNNLNIINEEINVRNINEHRLINNYLKKVISEYERIQFDKTNFKLCLLIIIDLMDNILKDIRVNEIEITLRFIILLSTFFLKGDNLIINLYCFNVRLKLLMEFISRFILFLVENLICINLTIPLYILLGRPREYFQYHDQLFFQLNYLTLKPNSERFADNWFLEALNFHKIKNMILFLKFCRYVFFISLLTIMLVPKVFLQFLNNFIEFKFSKLFFSYVKIVYNMIVNYLYYEPAKKNYYFFAFPFFMIYLFHNIFMTKDTIKIFILHFIIGLILNLLEEKENKFRNSISSRRSTYSYNFPNDFTLNSADYNSLNRTPQTGMLRNNSTMNLLLNGNINANNPTRNNNQSSRNGN